MNRLSEPTLTINTQFIPDQSDELCDTNTRDRKKKILSEEYVPKDEDVLVGRGKKCYDHFGNQKLRRIVTSKLDEYSASRCKFDKSNILSSIVAEVRMDGNFVKQDSKTGIWYDVGDLLAREKISQTFRDALHKNYKSSTTFKKKMRKQKKEKGVFSQNHVFGQSQAQNPLFIYRQLHLKTYSILKQQASSMPLRPPPSESIDVIQRLSSSLPSHFLEDEDPNEPIPISQVFSKETSHCGCCAASSKSLGADELKHLYFPLETIQLSNAGDCFMDNPYCLSSEGENNCMEPISISGSEDLDFHLSNEHYNGFDPIEVQGQDNCQFDFFEERKSHCYGPFGLANNADDFFL